MEKLKALSPWAEVDYEDARGLNPRDATLDGKFIGLMTLTPVSLHMAMRDHALCITRTTLPLSKSSASPPC